jgi:prepilin-type N-terminal cleavage/methylation domain-containing protein/prepilin-type processing-associated H-X9-DG protein
MKIKTPRRPGFTLVEILVVITIIISLAAVVLTATRNLRGSADMIMAIRNITQLQIANAGYAAENNGKYVPTFATVEKKKVAWFTNTKFLNFINGDGDAMLATDRVNNTVPLNLLDPIATKAKGKSYDLYSANFGYVECKPDPGTPETSWTVSQIRSPEKSATFISGVDFRIRWTGRSKWTGVKAVEGKASDGSIAYRHKGNKAVVVYYDGHVGELTMKDVEKFDDMTPSGEANLFWTAGPVATP